MEQLKIRIKEKVLNKQDKILLFNLLDKITESEQKNIVISTNIYNIHELSLIKENILKYVNNIYITGGYENFERAILIIYPQYVDNIEEYCKQNISNHLSLIKITYKTYGDEKISHRDVLGSILHLGINRNLIGDIQVNDDNCFVFVKPDIEKYILDNLKQIKHIKIETQKQDINQDIVNNDDGKVEKILINSLRLDNVLAHTLKLSRTKVNQLIDLEKVSINWKIEKKYDRKIELQDVISVRGKGRIQIKEIVGNSKKGKIIVQIEIKG